MEQSLERIKRILDSFQQAGKDGGVVSLHSSDAIGGDEELEFLVACLEKRLVPAELLCDALEVLRWMTPENGLSVMRSYLHHSSADVRALAVYGLYSFYSDNDSIYDIAARLYDSDPDVVRDALRTLALFKDEKCYCPINIFLGRTQDGELLSAGISAMAAYLGHKAFAEYGHDSFLGAMSVEEWFEWFSSVRHVSVGQLLAASLAHREPSVRSGCGLQRMIYHFWGKCSYPEYLLRAFIGALADPDPKPKQYAEHCLCKSMVSESTRGFISSIQSESAYEVWRRLYRFFLFDTRTFRFYLPDEFMQSREMQISAKERASDEMVAALEEDDKRFAASIGTGKPGIFAVHWRPLISGLSPEEPEKTVGGMGNPPFLR